MEMHQVRYFLAICEERNFTRAAQRCRVSQPSLTRAIRLLEAEFGGELFYRARPKVRLTMLGSLMRTHLKRIHQEAELAHDIAQKYSLILPIKSRVLSWPQALERWV